jgi:hypothetical protein
VKLLGEFVRLVILNSIGNRGAVLVRVAHSIGEFDVSHGDRPTDPMCSLTTSRQIAPTLFWMDDQPLGEGTSVLTRPGGLSGVTAVHDPHALPLAADIERHTNRETPAHSAYPYRSHYPIGPA